ncbi:MAG: putative lipoprotein, partial [Labilithrix sp.]|nr:putative lipoprotein [Labilithrix sp.]
DAGAVVVDCSRCAGRVGRVPEGLEPRAPTSAPSSLAAYFSAAAHLEAASVYAFRAFARELSAYDAPLELVSAATRAERDEVRHARAVGRLARRYGGRYVKPRVRAATVRPFEAFAQDNAVEGCVRETFGALVATWQAAHARDPEVARVLDVIANDETEHAALSWAVLRWSFARLGGEARARIADVCARAIDGVVDCGDGEGGRDEPELVESAGLPPRRIRRAFAYTLAEEVWSAFARVEDAAA